jgi:hypothetical protein
MTRILKSRDSQRSKVYRVDGWLLDRQEFYIGPTLRASEAFIKKVTGNKWVVRKWGRITPEVKDGRAGRWARGGTKNIILPVWARHRGIILHELAHGYKDKNFPFAADHGREFCRIYLDLVRRFLGPEVEVEMKDKLREHRVRWKMKRVGRPPSPQAIRALERHRRELALAEETRKRYNGGTP